MATFNFKLQNICAGGEHATLVVTGAANFSAPIAMARFVQIREALEGRENWELAFNFIALYGIFNDVTNAQIRNALTSASGATIEISIP